MPKRKAPMQLSTRSKKKRATIPGKAQPQTPFRFLDLPAELRTHILALFARDAGTALLKRTSRGQLSTADAVGHANKQVREEYIGVLYEHARTTLAHVRDFDFRHVVTYFNRLNKAEVEALPVKAEKSEQPPVLSLPAYVRKAKTKASAGTPPPTPERRIVKILLDFTPNASWQTGFLPRWLNRQQATHKIGSTVQFEYDFFSEEATWEWKGRRTWLDMARRLAWPGEQQAEVDKMVMAVRKGVEVQEKREAKERLTRLKSQGWWESPFYL